jgi:hypothetical protein
MIIDDSSVVDPDVQFIDSPYAFPHHNIYKLNSPHNPHKQTQHVTL